MGPGRALAILNMEYGVQINIYAWLYRSKPSDWIEHWQSLQESPGRPQGENDTSAFWRSCMQAGTPDARSLTLVVEQSRLHLENSSRDER